MFFFVALREIMFQSMTGRARCPHQIINYHEKMRVKCSEREKCASLGLRLETVAWNAACVRAQELTSTTGRVQLQRLGLLVPMQECMCVVKTIPGVVHTTWSSAEGGQQPRNTDTVACRSSRELLGWSAGWERSFNNFRQGSYHLLFE